MVEREYVASIGQTDWDQEFVITKIDELRELYVKTDFIPEQGMNTRWWSIKFTTTDINQFMAVIDEIENF